MNKILIHNEIFSSEAKKEKFFTILNFSIPILLGLYIFFNPFPHTTAIKEFCFYTSLLFLLFLIIFKKVDFSLNSPLSVPFIFFFLWGVFGLFFTLDLNNSVHDLRAHFLKYIFVFYLLINYFNTSKRLEILSWIIISSATCFSLGAVIDFYFIEKNAFSERLGLNFLEIHTDYIGFVLIFALILTVNKFFNNKSVIVRAFLVINALILCLTTLMTQSRGSLIALLIALFILCGLNRKILFLIVLAIMLVIIIPGFKERINYNTIFKNERVQMNALTIEIIKSYPLAGIGFGMQIYGNKHYVDLKKFDSRLPQKYQGGVGGAFIGSPHNILLDIAVRTGIVGLILFMGIVMTAMWMIWKTGKSVTSEYLRSWTISIFAAFASFMIIAFFCDATFGPQAIVFYTILAIITIIWNMNRKSELIGDIQ